MKAGPPQAPAPQGPAQTSNETSTHERAHASALLPVWLLQFRDATPIASFRRRPSANALAHRQHPIAAIGMPALEMPDWLLGEPTRAWPYLPVIRITQRAE